MDCTTSGKFIPPPRQCHSIFRAVRHQSVRGNGKDHLMDTKHNSMQQHIRAAFDVLVTNNVLGELNLICFLHGVH